MQDLLGLSAPVASVLRTRPKWSDFVCNIKLAFYLVPRQRDEVNSSIFNTILKLFKRLYPHWDTTLSVLL